MQLSKQVESFRSNLEEFAGQHREEIRRNPQFRSQFQQMCAAIGVDPLACKFSYFTVIFVLFTYVRYCLWTWNDNGEISSDKNKIINYLEYSP